MAIGADLGGAYSGSYPCPKCKEPVYSFENKCWHCGWNTAWYEEDLVHIKVTDRTNTLTGLSSSYYQLPEGCKELQDLIEYKNMNFARGNVFKAVYRLGDKPGTDQVYDWEKVIWFAQREINRLKGIKE